MSAKREPALRRKRQLPQQVPQIKVRPILDRVWRFTTRLPGVRLSLRGLSRHGLRAHRNALTPDVLTSMIPDMLRVCLRVSTRLFRNEVVHRTSISTISPSTMHMTTVVVEVETPTPGPFELGTITVSVEVLESERIVPPLSSHARTKGSGPAGLQAVRVRVRESPTVRAIDARLRRSRDIDEVMPRSYRPVIARSTMRYSARSDRITAVLIV